MPVSGAIALTGAKELDRQLGLIEPKLQRKALRQAVRKSTKYVHKEAKRLAPKTTGTTQRALRVRTLARRGGTRAQRKQIGATVVTSRAWFKAEKYYHPFVELGTSQKKPRRHLRKALFESKNVVQTVFRGELYVGIKEIARTARMKINNARA